MDVSMVFGVLAVVNSTIETMRIIRRAYRPTQGPAIQGLLDEVDRLSSALNNMQAKLIDSDLGATGDATQQAIAGFKSAVIQLETGVTTQKIPVIKAALAKTHAMTSRLRSELDMATSPQRPPPLGDTIIRYASTMLRLEEDTKPSIESLHYNDHSVKNAVRYWPGFWNSILQCCFLLAIALPLLVNHAFAMRHGLTNIPTDGLVSQDSETVQRLALSGFTQALWDALVMGTLIEWCTCICPSAQVFGFSSVVAAMMLRLYAFRNRFDRYQKWFALTGLVGWPIFSIVMKLDLLAGSICVMPWTVFGSLLVSHALHFAIRTMSHTRVVLIACDYSTRKQDEAFEVQDVEDFKDPCEAMS
ncbi:hypothetical protein LTR17_005133 [Elasticomyces elasticus]|nr:hypothetical protein LTR17_005133 [Elasticomyces elasticus]